MEGQADDSCTADLSSLLIDMGVQVKNPLSSSSSSSSPPVAQRRNPSKDLTHLTSRELNPKGEQKRRFPCRDRDGHSHYVVCRDRSKMILWALFAVLLGAAVLLALGAVVYSEIRDLNKRLHRLEAVCGGVASEWPGSQTPHGFPRQRDAGSAVPAGQEHGSPFKNEGNGQDSLDDHDDGDDDEEGHWYYDLLFEHSRQKRSIRTKRARKTKPNCRKLENCIKGKEKGKKPNKRCARMLKCLPPPQQPAPKFSMPVHFTSNYHLGGRQQKFGKDSDSAGLLMTGEDWCMFVKEWNATACSNRTVFYHGHKAPLRLTEEAHWMKHLYKDKSQQPLQSLPDGGFSVTQSGVYFFYSSVMFHDLKPRQSQAIVVNGEKLFKCMDSVDALQEPHKYKTCSISGVSYVNAGDRLEVQNLYGQTEIDQTQDATYFGAILLFPFQIK